MNEPRGYELLELPDGRKLAYSIYGQRQLDRPVVYLHGFPGSRLEPAFADSAAKRLGLSIIAPDRPGFGRSSERRGAEFTDWPGDLDALLESLQVRRYGILGVSGGAPYALASARARPERLVAALVVSGVSPAEGGALSGMALQNRMLFRLARRAPRFTKLVLMGIGSIWKLFPRTIIWWLRSTTTRADRRTLDLADFSSQMVMAISEGLRGGTSAAADDFLRLARPWPFRLEEISAPVAFWHGLQDIYVPHSMSSYSASRVPGAVTRLVPGQGHSMVFTIKREVLSFFRDAFDAEAHAGGADRGSDTVSS